MIISFRLNKIFYFIFVLLLSAVLIYLVFNIYSVPSITENMEFKVVIDPGHGSIDTGTHYKDIYEKNINLALGRHLNNEYKKVNIIPIMTRNEDKLYQDSRNKDLKHRPEVARKYDADLFISLHVNNFSTSQPSGSQIFYKPGCKESRKLAGYIRAELKKLRPVNDRELTPGNFYVLNQVTCPAIMVEAGFLSNPADRKNLTDPEYQQDFAAAIKKGTVNYLRRRMSGITDFSTEKEEKSKDPDPVFQVFVLDVFKHHLQLTGVNFTYPTGLYLNRDYHSMNKQEIMALAALEQLINPPQNLKSPLPPDTEIISVTRKNNVLCINFSHHLKTNFAGGAGMEQLTVKAIKKSLLSLPGINRIEILLEGQKIQSIGGHILLE